MVCQTILLGQDLAYDGGLTGMIVTVLGIAILVIATLGAVLWVRRSAPGQPRQAKILLFGLYFWVLAFVQLIVAALFYYVYSR